MALPLFILNKNDIKLNIKKFNALQHTQSTVCAGASKGGLPDLNREHTVPHTIVLPIELYPPFCLLVSFNKNV